MPPPNLDYWKTIGDAEADAVVAGIQGKYGGGEVRKQLAKVGRWKPGSAPGGLLPEVAGYLDKPYVFPNWVNFARLKQAQCKYQVNAGAGQVVLGLYSLPVLYIDPDITLVLMGTGRLVQHTKQRVMETQAFVDQAMKPGDLNKAGPGWQWMRKVRLTHAVLRAVAKLGKPSAPVGSGGSSSPFFEDPLHILNSNTQLNFGKRTDVPLDQVELAFVLLTFSWVMVDGLSKLGFRLSSAEREDHIYAWAVVGHMIGIVDELLPGGPGMPVGEARPLFERIRLGLLAAGDPLDPPIPPGAEEGRVLMAALLAILVDVQRQSIRPPFRGWVARWHWFDEALQDLPRTLVRELVGRPTTRMLHLGRAPFLHWIVGQIARCLVDLNDRNGRVALTDEVQIPPRGLF